MKIIVGISGASGVILGFRTLLALRACGVETHLVMTEAAEKTWEYETDITLGELKASADHVYGIGDIWAKISSGSFVTDGMIVVPCSMKTLAGIVSGYSDNLLLRAADVCLKEGRRLVLCPREMPLGRVHLKNLTAASELGCSVVPPMLTFYHMPKSVDDMIDQVVGKLLLQFGLSSDALSVWQGQTAENRK